jgi:DNA-binding transcriptional regulator YiaG
MSNITAVLKELIHRHSRKEIRTLLGKTRQNATACRKEIARLKRTIQVQAKQIALMQKQLNGLHQAPPVEEDPLTGARFSARSVRAQRKRLKLSAADYGKLVGVSALTIYHWESGKSRPRKSQLVALKAVRNIGKREAQRRLESPVGPQSTA